ncbi:hypothetical protein ACSS6W_006648 [Trichoderma asperelloides]
MNTFATISITTRTTSDVVATRLKLKRAVGGSENRCPTSAPVGTTVQVTKLFDTLPARKQYSLRNSAKYIKSTKDLFKAYVLARPDLRLSFKILGEAVGGWSYAPVCAAEINKAALQIFGKALANSCIHVSRNSACDQAAVTQANQETAEDFILEAFMPKIGFDVPAVKGKGLYLSVDSRPLSSACNIAKKITAIFKIHLNRVTGSSESCPSISNPFLRLNIRCPAHSYDANVTPLKDEVVFGDENRITACFEGLCQRIYSERFMADPFLSSKPSRSEEEADDSKSHIENSGNMHTKDLNTFRESESDVSSVEPETLTLGDIERTIDANTREERTQQISPVPTPSSPDHEPLALRSPRQPRSVAEWLTPPSSGPLRNVRLSNSSFRPQQRTSARDSLTGNVVVRPRPRAPQSGRTIPFTLPGENRNRRRLTHNETIGQELDIPRANPRETRAQLYFQGVQGLNRQQDRTTNAFELATQLDTTGQPVSHPNFFSHEPGHRSHIIQTSLLDSQYSGAIPSSRTVQEVLNARDSLSATPQRDIRPSIEASVCGDSRNRAPFRNTHGKLEDPRLYLIKRRRSQARHGIARRLSSRRLPLEVTPNHLAMQSSLISRRLSLRRVKALAKQTSRQDYDIVPGDWGNAITFESMEEAGKVESRLQDAVDSWKQTQNQAIEVEYKLRSAAKGKNPALTDQ